MEETLMAKTQTGADLKKRFAPLSEADIQAFTDDKSYQKGYDYYLNRSIIEPILSESVLRAFCHGSDRNPYRVEAALLPAGETSARKLAATSCSCPRGGFCKHLVALLLTWLHQPESFIVRKGLIGRLSMKSHEELVALLEQLIQRQRDVEPLIEMLMELPLAPAAQEEKRPGKGRACTVDLSAIHRQVDLAFYNAGDDWNAASNIAYALERVYDIGKSFAQAGQWANALFVYSTIAEEAISRYEDIHDEGQVSWTLGECATGLVECLSIQSSLSQDDQLDEGEREELLEALFRLWKFGYDYGNVDVDIAGGIAEHATKLEQESVEAWLRQEMEDSSSKWRASSIINFLVMLKQAGPRSDEDVLEEYRNAGLYRELTEKFLQLGRINEALDVARTNLTESRDVIWFAEQLLTSGEAWQEPALAFVETRLSEVERIVQRNLKDLSSIHAVDNYRQWLSKKYILYGSAKQALDMELSRFHVRPDETTYQSVRSATQAANQPEETWSGLRPRLIQTLEQNRRWEALVSIYLQEKEVSQAIAALAEMERISPGAPYISYGYRAGGIPYGIQVAQAAEEYYPNDAIRLYQRAAQTLINGRGRESYQRAASYLTRVRMLYQKQGQEPEWRTYITNLRTSNKSLRALKEELDKKNL
jgi:SWIM zinc finger